MINKENRVVENYDEDIQVIECDKERTFYRTKCDPRIPILDEMTDYKMMDAVARLLEISDDKETQDTIIKLQVIINNNIDEYYTFLKEKYDDTIFAYANQLIRLVLTKNNRYLVGADTEKCYIFNISNQGRLEWDISFQEMSKWGLDN